MEKNKITKRNEVEGMRRKVVALGEVGVMIVSLFAFCHFVFLSESLIPLVSAAPVGDKSDWDFDDWVSYYRGGELIEEEDSWSRYPISSNAEGAGCCFVSIEGDKCGTAIPENCLEDSPFAEGVLCSETPFCEKGCCYNEETGVFDENVLEIDCPFEWSDDSNCNMPEADNGCCFVGDLTFYGTRGECELYSLTYAIGGSEEVDWRGEMNEAECSLSSATQKRGACVLEEGECKFLTESDCRAYDGDFAEGFLCTSPSLDTVCEMSEQTACVDWSDRVYFLDSCGNVGNVYDSSRAHDVSYWDRVVDQSRLCGASDLKNGNANSEDCGNCGSPYGSRCGSAEEDGFDVDMGGFYCRDASCMFEGKSYRNGESWCVYDGAIGDGDDVVGSRHWKYVCAQGIVRVEPCKDARNYICIQSETIETGNGDVEFSSASCVANNWRECIGINGEEDTEEKCEQALNCRIEEVAIADKFNFNVCLPKYPGGFLLTEERFGVKAEMTCGMASLNCTYVQKPKTWGGCKDVANKACISPVFTQKMNEFCMGLGDCGGAVNINGEYVENYAVKVDNSLNRGYYLSDSWIEGLVALATPIDGQFAEAEDYTDYLVAAGVFGDPDEVAFEGNFEELEVENLASGIAGVGLVAGAMTKGYIAAGAGWEGIGWAGSYSPYFAGFANLAIGAAVGMVAGAMLAKSMGLSEGGSILMAVGGALVGTTVAIAAIYGIEALSATLVIPGLGWAVFAVGVVLMVAGSLFGGSDCDPVQISFECKPWNPPVGGDDCESCNGDPLKPCSRYRCESLGSSCELINVGSDDELCVNANPNDVVPPVIFRQKDVVTDGVRYVDNSDGFSVVGLDGGCVPAYTPLMIGVTTSEPAQCKLDVVSTKEFDDMESSFGLSSYLYNHTILFPLPDPSHGQSQGLDWSGEAELYVRCRDRAGVLSPGVFKIDMCVVEGEDLLAPRVVKSSPESGGLVGFDVETSDVSIVTNEFADCRWDFVDVAYSEMVNDMTCSDSFGNPSDPYGYVCSAVLPVLDEGASYYVRCADQPWLENLEERNVNLESFVYELGKPVEKIYIEKISPEDGSVIKIGTDSTTVDLKIATGGGGSSHFCSYSLSGYDYMFELVESGSSRVHEIPLNRPAGVDEIFVECRDETGDVARESTTFEIIKDDVVPAVARVWQSNGFVNLVLIEEGECRYSVDGCNFAWGDGVSIGDDVEMSFRAVRVETYYINCEDEFGNMPDGCSVEVIAV